MYQEPLVRKRENGAERTVLGLAPDWAVPSTLSSVQGCDFLVFASDNSFHPHQPLPPLHLFSFFFFFFFSAGFGERKSRVSRKKKSFLSAPSPRRCLYIVSTGAFYQVRYGRCNPLCFFPFISFFLFLFLSSRSLFFFSTLFRHLCAFRRCRVARSLLSCPPSWREGSEGEKGHHYIG